MTKTLKELRWIQRHNKEPLNVHKVNSVHTLCLDWFSALILANSVLEVFQHCDFSMLAHGWKPATVWEFTATLWPFAEGYIFAVDILDTSASRQCVRSTDGSTLFSDTKVSFFFFNFMQLICGLKELVWKRIINPSNSMQRL